MSVRKSARLEIRPPKFNNLELDAVFDKDDDFEEENENVSNHEPGPSRRKRVKTKARSATKNPKGKKGRLGALPYVPPSRMRSSPASQLKFLLALQRNATGYFVRGQR
jgi:hypothetical protein